jgi:hypothetical protein
MNSLGIKRAEAPKQLFGVLMQVSPHFASLIILIVFGVWARSPFASPYVAAETSLLLSVAALSPFILFSLLAYLIIASILLVASRITSLSIRPITKHFLVATITGFSVFLLVSIWFPSFAATK